jgi:hypothetical protein
MTTPKGHDFNLLIDTNPPGVRKAEGLIEQSLLRALMAGRVYLRGNNGEMHPVVNAWQWIDGEIMSTKQGGQYDEDGNDV